MKLRFKPLVASTILLCASMAISAQNTANEPVLQKSDAITIAVNYAKVQPYEDKKVEVQDFLVNDVKDLNGVTRSYEVSLFDSAKQAVGFINVPVKEGFDVVSDYSFNGISKTDRLRKQFAKKIELVELETGNKAFFVGYEYGAIGVAVKLDGKTLSSSAQGYQVIGDYAVFSSFQKSLLKGLIEPASKKITTYSSADKSAVDARLAEETDLRRKLLNGDTDIEQGEAQTRTLSIGKGDTVTGNSVGGQPMENGKTEYKGYNQYYVYKESDDSVCTSGCTPAAYMIIFDYWDRKKFPNLIAGPADREKNTVKAGVYYGEGDYKYAVDLSRWTEDHMDVDAFTALLKIRSYLKTECDALTRNPNVTKAEQYIKDRGYDGKVTRVAGLFGNQLAFNKLKAEIDAGRPALMGMTMDGTWQKGHSGVAYGYRDAPGTQHDKIYVIMGLGMSEGTAIKRNFQVSASSVIIKEKPKPAPVNAPAQAELTTWQKIQAWFRSWRR